MSEKSFDIEHFLNFKPSKYICLKCKALLHELEEVINSQNTECIGYRCPICKMIYLRNEFFCNYQEFFSYNNYQINFDNDIVEHCKSLATIATSAKEYLLEPKEERNLIISYPPKRAFLESIQEAKKFVHFVSFGMSSSIFGALQAAAVKVPVRGIVSGVSKKQRQDIEDFSYESPGLQIHAFLKGDRSSPHQKFVIIDGLLAFAGSVNLTDNGLRNAEKGRDIIEYITDIQKIVSLNNNHFSPVWSEFYEINEIDMMVNSICDFDRVY